MAIDLLFGLLPEHLLLGLLLVLMLLEICGTDKRFAGMLFLLAVGAGCIVVYFQLAQGYTVNVVPGEIQVDRFALLAKLVILSCGLALGLCFPANPGTFKFWILLSSSLLGALVIMDSAGFISLFIGVEMLSLPAFALMVHGCGATTSSEGAFKYLLLSSVATALMLFGISLSYGSTGTLAIASFASAFLAGGPQNLAAGILVLSGFFMKAAVFPFHAWAPDAYSGAKLQITAFLASVIKAAVILALVRIFSTGALNIESITAITALAVVSIYYGNVTAIKQTRFKRLLAYSSIAHAGYMVFALVDSTGARAEALLYYTVIYALMTIIACASFAVICPSEHDDLEAIDGAFSSHPWSAVFLALAVLSLAGIPPLPGFFAKLFVFKAVIGSGHLVAAIVAFTGSFIGVTYYLGIVFRLFKTAQLPVKEPTASY